MITELVIFFKFSIFLLIFAGVMIWLGSVFQNIKFQKYRLFKNEAAYRKARLHDQKEEEVSYKNNLLGKVEEEDA